MSPNPLKHYLYNYFISYSTLDRAFARSLSQHLFAQSSRTCWCDYESMPPADHYPTVIFNAIGRCRQLIVLVSVNALASNWVVPEVWAALGNDLNNRSHRVIPVKIGDSSLPTPLDQIHAIDARGGITPSVLESILSITRQ